MFVIGVSNTVHDDDDYNTTSTAINSSKTILLPVKAVAILRSMSKARSLQKRENNGNAKV